MPSREIWRAFAASYGLAIETLSTSCAIFVKNCSIAARTAGSCTPSGLVNAIWAWMPARSPKPFSLSRSNARWLSEPGSPFWTLNTPPAEPARTDRPISSTTQTARTARRWW